MRDEIGRRLRIGITIGDSRLSEREFSRLHDVTFGTSPDADLMIPQAPGAKLPKKKKLFSLVRSGLFRHKAIGYALMATRDMRGTLVEGERRMGIAESLGNKPQRRIPFGIRTRGKVEIGSVKILFIMVQPRTNAPAKSVAAN
jgi:hypothetical protein